MALSQVQEDMVAMISNARQAVKEALESTTPAQERTFAQRHKGLSSLPTEHERTLQRDTHLRFLQELSNMDCEDMTISELILHLEEL